MFLTQCKYQINYPLHITQTTSCWRRNGFLILLVHVLLYNVLLQCITEFQTTFRLNFSFFIINLIIKNLTFQKCFCWMFLQKCIVIPIFNQYKKVFTEKLKSIIFRCFFFVVKYYLLKLTKLSRPHKAYHNMVKILIYWFIIDWF